MKKTALFNGFVVALAVVGLLNAGTAQAATYYSEAGTVFASSGGNWNTHPDGSSGSSGYSSTYKSGHNLVLQSHSSFKMAGSYYSDNPWNASSYSLGGATLFFDSTGSGTFNGGDITVTTNGVLKTSGSAFINGSSTLQLGTKTLSFTTSNGSTAGTFEFGLNVSGGGDLDLGTTPSGMIWEFSNLSTLFTGRVLADTFSGIIRFAAGDDARETELVLAADAAKTGRLDVNGLFSLDSLTIEGIVIPAGVYDYADLIAVGTASSKTFSDNLVDNGGTVYVGVLVNAETIIAVNPTILDADWETGEWTSGDSPPPVFSFQLEGDDPQPITTVTNSTHYIKAASTYARTGDWSLEVFAQPDSKRSEIAYIDTPYRFSPGSEFYYSLSYRPDDGWATNTSPYSIILTQWKNFSSGPHAVFRLRNNAAREAFFMSAVTGSTQHELGTLPVDEWTDFIFYFKFETGTSGATKIWKNGELILSLTGATLFNSNNGYMKLGMYTEINHPRIVHFDDVRIGTSTFMNGVPAFDSDLFSASNATENTAYSDSIDGWATDVDGDPLAYYKKSGPVWLNIATNGALSGMPGPGDLGLNAFTVEVKDDVNGRAEATLNIMVATQYDTWIDAYNVGGATAYTNNPDGDSMDNLMEYGLGGNPTNANDVGILPVTEVVEGAADWFYYIYNRRPDAVDRSLTYDVLNNLALVDGTWTNEYQLEIGVSAPFIGSLGDEFESVTNRISMTGKTNEFTKLEITISE